MQKMERRRLGQEPVQGDKMTGRVVFTQGSGYSAELHNLSSVETFQYAVEWEESIASGHYPNPSDVRVWVDRLVDMAVDKERQELNL